MVSDRSNVLAGSDRNSSSNSVPVKPLCVLPWQPALNNADLVVPALMEIAATGVPFIHYPAQPAAQTLNMAAEYLLESDYTHLLNLDIDHVHPPDVVKRLASQVGRWPDIKILGGLNFQRAEPHTPCFWFERDGEVATPLKWKPEWVMPGVRIGFGCTIVAKEVFQTTPPPWFMYDYTNMEVDANYQYPGPDMYFCEKARQAGFEIYCDMGLTSPHIAYQLVGEKEYRISVRSK